MSGLVMGIGAPNRLGRCDDGQRGTGSAEGNVQELHLPGWKGSLTSERQDGWGGDR